MLVLLLAFAAIYSGQANFSYFALLPLLVLNLAYIYSIGLILACTLPFFPDGRKVVDNLFHLLFFASGIFFNFREAGELGQLLMTWNPFAALLMCYRDILLLGQLPAPSLVWSSVLATVVFTLLAATVYRLTRAHLAKALMR